MKNYKLMLTEIKHLENFGFLGIKITDQLTNYRYQSDDIIIDVYYNPLVFGFCSTDKIENLDFTKPFEIKDFVLKNESLNHLDKLISFIESKSKWNLDEIVKKLTENE